MSTHQSATNQEMDAKKTPHDGAPVASTTGRPPDSLLEWIKVLGPLVISWPLFFLLFVLVFRAPMLKLFDRFIENEGSTAELGPIKIALGKAPVIPPQYRNTADTAKTEHISLVAGIGEIRDSGPEGATVGFALAYALQAEIRARTGRTVTVSPRGIYALARRYDEWPGESYEGTSVEGGLKALREIGAYLESDWPYSQTSWPTPRVKPAYRISSYRRVNGVEGVLSAMREDHVVVASITVTEDFDKPRSDGTVTIKLPLRELGGKAIALVGYDSRTASFTFANDWGKTWGRDGFGVIKDTDLARILVDAYVIEL